MGIKAEVALFNTGSETPVPMYVSFQQITIIQRRVPENNSTFWTVNAQVVCFASKEAKIAGLNPLEITTVSMIHDPAVNVFEALYNTLKQEPRFAGAIDA